MARETRLMRRVLGSAFRGALMEAERRRVDRFARVLPPNKASTDPETGYVFMVLAFPTDFELKDGYAQYRKVRVAMLEAYCSAALYDNRSAKRMVGIALDAHSSITGRKGGSEDLLVVEINEWTSELEAEIEDRRKVFDVLNPKSMEFSSSSTKEYPTSTGMALSRQQRRAAERKARKGFNKAEY